MLLLCIVKFPSILMDEIDDDDDDDVIFAFFTFLMCIFSLCKFVPSVTTKFAENCRN